MSDMLTIDRAVEAYGVQIEAEFDGDELVPVLDGLQFQGDVCVRPAAVVASTPVSVKGVAVVRGESMGNTHLLLPGLGCEEGSVMFDSSDDGSLVVGVLTVKEGATALLAHPEHGYSGVAPGSYEVRRQREMADEIRLVQD